MNYIHRDPSWKDLVLSVAAQKGILPALVEKDYWIMHALWGLKKQGFSFYLKGGTSLSKGYGIIDRFSEDIDILIDKEERLSKKFKYDTSSKCVKKRKKYFDELAIKMQIVDFESVERDVSFDDEKYRSAGIRLNYKSLFASSSLKTGILLEAGFDQVEPFELRDISSWVFDHLLEQNQMSRYVDNRAIGVPCYLPGYTLIEKLQAVSTKYRQLQEGKIPANFARHYYDIYRLLQQKEVQKFIGSKEYLAHKKKRFRQHDEVDLSKNPAFMAEESYQRVDSMYRATADLYYGDVPSYEEILKKIEPFKSVL